MTNRLSLCLTSPSPRGSLWRLTWIIIILTLSMFTLMTGAKKVRGQERMSSAEAAVQDKINSAKVVIFSKTSCPYCQRAKAIFKEIGETNILVMELNELSEGPRLQDAIKKVYNHYTVPAVFINGKLIGGASDVETLYQSGELQRMLRTNEEL